MRPDFDSIVVGGGFFGSYFAYRLAERGERVLLLEKEPQLLGRASILNQARIHRGYHYPRSVLTGFRSAVNFARFVTDLRTCVRDTYPSYYAIAKKHSNVTSAQFIRFCATIGAPLSNAPAKVTDLFNPDLIDSVFAVEEYVFDGDLLRQEMIRRLERADVEIALSSPVAKISGGEKGVRVFFSEGAEFKGTEPLGSRVFICCYALLNSLLKRSGYPVVSIKYELTEMALLEAAEPLDAMAVTVMCGPFFSVMPYPSRNMHTLSHVRYTPHFEWSEKNSGDPDEILARRGRSRYPEMIRDAGRYLPLLRSSRYVDSIWEIKALLPRSEINDSRPILLVTVPDDHRVTCVLGAKIDNVYDVWDMYESSHLRPVSSG